MSLRHLFFSLSLAVSTLSPLAAFAQPEPSMYGDRVKADVKLQYVYTLDEALARARAEKKPIFFNCFADWAIPCHGMNKYVFSDAEFADYMNRNFVNLYIDVSKRANAAVAKRYDIRRFAHFLVLDADGNVLLRREQYRRADDETASLALAKNFILGKIYNARWMIERTHRDYAMRIDEEKFQSVSDFLQTSCHEATCASNLEELRGVEGKAAVSYFSVFDDMILKQKGEFFFTERNRRPPLDNMNCLLSFLYALLMNDVGAALEGVGLDSYVGFLHRDRPGRQSLAIDLMEELRAMTDRTAFSMVNTKKISGKDFRLEEGGAVYLTDDGRKKILEAWHAHKEGMMTHPFLEEKI